VKLLGWIKSAVEFIKPPASPRQTGLRQAWPQPDVPGEVDSHTVAQDASPDAVETRPHSPISVEPEIRLGVESESRISVEPEGLPSQEEIDRRRGVVRAFFNDYWSSADDKPASFAERLDRAEGYINERVAAGGESWRLGPATRKQLGLPPSRKE
jgi:hypothetical protein